MLLLLWACSSSAVETIPICEVQLYGAEPTLAAPGEAVVVSGTPFTTENDTALYVGGVRAQVVSVDRPGCEACDECREDEACTVCEDCDDCDATCESECSETLRFLVPELPSGAAVLQLFNTHGGSNSLAFEVSGAADTGADTSPPDTNSF